MADAGKNAFTTTEVVATGYSMIAITSVVAIGRVAIHFIAPRPITAEDCIVMLAYVMNITLCTLYISLTPVAEKVAKLDKGIMPLYESLSDDIMFISRRYFIAFLLFWVVLWMIKLSFMLLYRKLLVGIPKLYTWIWWGIIGACLLTFPANFALFLTMCSTGLTDFFNGTCKDLTADKQLVSLLYSYGADTVTNIMIMALPIRLTWDLRMTRSKKIGVIAIFATAILCVIMATVRVAQITENTTKNLSKSIDGTWLAIWGMAESSCAVLVGFIPASAALIRIVYIEKKTSSNSRGYQKQNGSQVLSGSRMGQFEMTHLSTTATRAKKASLSESFIYDDASSQEALAPLPKRDEIVVTTTVDQTYGPPTKN